MPPAVQDEQEHVAELAAAAATLERQLASANSEAAKQSEAFARLGRESLSLKEALTQMKTRSAEMAVSAQVGPGPGDACMHCLLH